MDETMDNGYPQITETMILKEYIKTESHKKQFALNTINTANDQKISNTITNLVSWRKDNIKYDRNEVYLDVIEKVNCIVF